MDVLLENPIIIMIIIGAILSLFNKSKVNNQNQKNPSSQTKPTQARSISNEQGQRRPVDDRKGMSPVKRLEQMATEMAERYEREYAEKRKFAEATLKQAKEEPRPMEREAEQLYVAPVKSVTTESITSQEKQMPAPQLSLTAEKQKVINGVVWAEIMGPPRALNPHRSLRRK